jgi:hypothetical protein
VTITPFPNAVRLHQSRNHPHIALPCEHDGRYAYNRSALIVARNLFGFLL